MKRFSKISAVFDEDITTIWNVITNNNDFKWRTDIIKLEVIDEKTFVEYYKNDHSTTFTITQFDVNETYAFTMDNKMFQGEWTGKFETLKNGQVQITFTEIIHIHNPFIHLASYIGMPLKKIQKQYISDLRSKLKSL